MDSDHKKKPHQLDSVEGYQQPQFFCFLLHKSRISDLRFNKQISADAIVNDASTKL